jgi:precorrin-2 dehydrogenase / sirohydrochlorin ferrochelatase
VRENAWVDSPGANVEYPAFPLFVRLAGRQCLVVGGGKVGASKAASLLSAGAVVRMISLVFDPDALALDIARETRGVVEEDLAGNWLIVAATGDTAVNRQITAWAEKRQLWVNAVDDPEPCTALLGAIHRDDPLTIVVSTDGRSPAGSSWARDRIAASMADTADVVRVSAAARARIKAMGRTSEGLPWRELLNEVASELQRSTPNVDRIVEAWFASHVDASTID